MFEIKKEVLATHEALLNVEIEEAAVKEAMRKAARVMSQKYNIPGFRRGKAPYAKVVKYVGEAALLQEAADAMLEEIYPEILDKAEVDPYGPGELQDIKPDPLTFIIRVPLSPEVVLGDYNNLSLEWEDVIVNDEEVADVLEQVREEHAVLEALERPAEYGDEVHINVLGTVDSDVIVEEDDIEVVLKEDVPFVAPGFVEALVGMSLDEEKSFTVVFPETFSEESLRGEEGEFEVKVVGVYDRVLPDLDDALASTAGSFETLEELKQDIYTRLLEAKQRHAQEHYRDDLVSVLVAQSDVHYPPVMVEHALDDMIEDMGRRIQREQRMSLEDAIQLQGITVEQLRQQMKPQAEADVKRSLVLTEFAEAQGIVVSDDEVVQEYQSFMTAMGQAHRVESMPLTLDSPMGHNLRMGILSRKTLEHLEKIGRGEVDADAVMKTPEIATEEASTESEDIVEETVIEAEDAPVVEITPEQEEDAPTAETTEAQEEDTLQA
ncbi:MAG: trigger factor [Anaerolineae bacterium]|nr:trigger factor [Anaerolineae bacterium]